jgi:hypothetical protein
MTAQITLSDYWMQRDYLYSRELTPEIIENAKGLLAKVNKLLIYVINAKVELEVSPATKSLVSSGWRPPRINNITDGAAPKSKHLIGLAVDLYDPEGEIDNFCMSNPDKLEKIGLWMEHPSATKGWCHLQSVPPRSGNRVFYP